LGCKGAGQVRKFGILRVKRGWPMRDRESRSRVWWRMVIE